MTEEAPIQYNLYDPTAGDLSLAFLNTVNWRGQAEPEEILNRWEDLLAWAGEAGLVNSAERSSLAACVEADPQQARRALANAKNLRENLYKIFLAIISGELPGKDEMETFNAALQLALAQREIQAGAGNPHWAWKDAAQNPEAMLWPVLLAAAELLVSDDLDRIHRCANETCGWMFIDRSRNGSRKWCSSQSCGNRIRVRAFYARNKEK
jgi:predicted RNA-binding Zn ribbon-like protein